MKPKRILATLLAAAFGAALAGAALAQGKTQLLVYTALETDQLKAYEQGFYKEYPNIEIAGCAIPPAWLPPSSSPRSRTPRPTP